MIVVEHNKIELDHCVECHGIWFDSVELELLLKSLNLPEQELTFKNIFEQPEAVSPERKRKCPICRRKMKKSEIGREMKILIDICYKGDGLWLDGGELTGLLKDLAEKKTARQGSQEQVIGFLGDTFKAHDSTGESLD